MAARIRQNFDKLCEKTDVNESLINALYSKAVIDREFTEVLVRFRFVKIPYSISQLMLFLMKFHVAIPEMEYPEMFQALRTL
jgi:hypothetical protein